MEITVPWILSVIGSLWIGSYFSPYLRKRAENLATHEDLDNLVAQMQATTEATKAIEARISDQVWNKQRQWEIKRDTLFEGCRIMAEFDSALLRVHSVYLVLAKECEDITYKDQLFVKYESEAVTAVRDASASFDRARLLISIVAGKEVQRALQNMGILLRDLFLQLVNGEKTIYVRLLPAVREAQKAVTDAMRNELGIEEAKEAGEKLAL